MMKLLVVGSDKVYAIENFFVKYLKEAGVDVQLFCATNIFLDYYQANHVNKIKYRLGISSIMRKINSQFKTVVSNYKPEIIWLFKGMEIQPESLKWARQNKIKLVNYNPDNPFIFTGKGSGNKNVTDSVSLFDMHFTYNLEIKKNLEKLFKIRTELLPFGFDIDDKIYKECLKEKEILKACFLGNPDKQRAQFILALADEGIEIDIFGNNWEKVIDHPNIRLHKAIYGDELWKILRKYRVQLNLMRIHNENSHNMRSFEVPGVGGIMLAPDTIEHHMYFEEGKEVFLYKTVTDCSAMIRKILALNETEALAIRENARNRSLKSGYTYKDRSMQALACIRSLKND